METQINIAELKQLVRMLQQLIDQVEGVSLSATTPPPAQPRFSLNNIFPPAATTVTEARSLADTCPPAPVLCAKTRPEPKVPPPAVESPPPEEDIADWWDDSDLKIKLKISTSTIQRRRKDGTFKFFCIGRRYYYLRQDILLIRHRFMR